MNAPLSLVSVKIMRASCTEAFASGTGCVAAWRPPWSAAESVAPARRSAISSLDMADALVSRPFELLERQPRLAVGLVQLLGAASRIPLRLECGQHARDLVEAHAVGPRVRARRRGDLDRQPGTTSATIAAISRMR